MNTESESVLTLAACRVTPKVDAAHFTCISNSFQSCIMTIQIIEGCLGCHVGLCCFLSMKVQGIKQK